MKKLRLLLATMLVIALMPAYGFVYNGLQYEIISSSVSPITVKLTGVMSTPIEDVVVPASFSNAGKTYFVTAIDESAFDNCLKTIKTLKMPRINIPDDMLFGAENLESVDWGEYWPVEIGQNAFRDCEKLASVSGSLENNKNNVIGHHAFHNCKSLSGTIQLTLGEYTAYIPYFGDYSFLNTKMNFNLTNCDLIPASGKAVVGSTSKVSVKSGMGAAYAKSDSWGHGFISDPEELPRKTYVFDGASSAAGTFASLISSMSDYERTSYRRLVYNGKINSDDLKAIRALCGGPESYGEATTDGNVRFLDLTHAQFITDNNSFYYENGTHSIDNNKMFASYALANCVKLDTVMLPVSVNGIGVWAFKNCKPLVLYASWSEPVSAYDAFETKSNTVIVPAGSVYAYLNTIWKDFGNIREVDATAAEQNKMSVSLISNLTADMSAAFINGYRVDGNKPYYILKTNRGDKITVNVPYDKQTYFDQIYFNGTNVTEDPVYHDLTTIGSPWVFTGLMRDAVIYVSFCKSNVNIRKSGGQVNYSFDNFMNERNYMVFADKELTVNVGPRDQLSLAARKEGLLHVWFGGEDIISQGVDGTMKLSANSSTTHAALVFKLPAGIREDVDIFFDYGGPDPIATETYTHNGSEAGSFATAMEALSQDAKLRLGKLIISGPLNSADVKAIRNLCGANTMMGGASTGYHVSAVDLTHSTFVRDESDFAADEHGGSFQIYANIMPAEMFRDCKSLSELWLPVNIMEIGGYVFENANPNMTVYASWNAPSSIFLNASTFSLVDNMMTLVVPAGALDTYRNEYYWKDFRTIIEGPYAGFGLKGDVNGDGNVTVADAVKVVSIILGSPSSTTE